MSSTDQELKPKFKVTQSKESGDIEVPLPSTNIAIHDSYLDTIVSADISSYNSGGIDNLNFSGDETDDGLTTGHFPSGGIFTITELLSTPFTFVHGNLPRHVKKKNGILSVLSKQDQKTRIVKKSGELNIEGTVEGSENRFLKDIFISLLRLPWLWVASIFTMAYCLSWIFFAVIWYLLGYFHGDMDESARDNGTFVPCLVNVFDFNTAFMFSLESQHTIGYGSRYPTDECIESGVILTFQSIIGVIIEACMAGIFFAKFTVPLKRGQTIVFSKNAVISLRNGALYFMCRITDLRKHSLLDAHVQMFIIKKEVTEENETIPYQQTEMGCGYHLDGTNNNICILWPKIVAHKIDKNSPLYSMRPSTLLSSKFEIIVQLIGVTEETGNTVRVRTSYMPNEILWGHRFDASIFHFDEARGIYVIDYKRKNYTMSDNTPRKSAKYLEAKSAGLPVESEESSRACSSAYGTYRTN